MKESKLDEIKKELEKVIDFREGTGILENSFFGEYKGTSITLSYHGDYSSVWIGRMDNEHKMDIAMSLLECTVETEESKIRFHSQDCVIAVGE